MSEQTLAEIRKALGSAGQIVRVPVVHPAAQAPAAPERVKSAPLDHVAESVKDKNGRYHFSGWTLDPTRRELTNPEGNPEEITTAEFDVLERLAKNIGSTVTRREIATEGFARPYHGPEDRSIDQIIARLRAKSHHRLPIKTVFGRGYMIQADANLAIRDEEEAAEHVAEHVVGWKLCGSLADIEAAAKASHPAWTGYPGVVQYKAKDGTLHVVPPHDQPYTIIVHDEKRYDELRRSGALNAGHRYPARTPTIDNRKTS